MEDKKVVSSSHERVVKGYLRPALKTKFENYIKVTGITKSEAINEGIRLLIDRPR
jgi:hypothetical protein